MLPARVVGRVLDAVVPVVVAEVVRRADLTTLVIRYLDVDAVVATVDLDAVLNRLDLAGLAKEVLDAVELSEIIRESTSSVLADSIRRARTRGVAADDAVDRVRNRLLRAHDR